LVFFAFVFISQNKPVDWNTSANRLLGHRPTTKSRRNVRRGSHAAPQKKAKLMASDLSFINFEKKVIRKLVSLNEFI
jgi:hypothetical protein